MITADVDAERGVLAAGMRAVDSALRIAQELAASDFSEEAHRAVYLTVARLALRPVAEISPALVVDELDPAERERAGLDEQELQSWVLDSAAVRDHALFEAHLVRLKHLRRYRAWTDGLRRALSLDPAERDPERRGELERLLREANDNLAQIYSSNGGPGLHAVDIEHAIESRSERIPWVYQGWLAVGDVAMLAGKPGIGKSWVALELALSLARGVDFLGSARFAEDLPPQRVLVVDEEANERLIRYRINRLVRGSDIGPDGVGLIQSNVRYLVGNGLNLDDPGGFQRLSDEVDVFLPHWIVFDSLVRVHQRRENDNAEMSGFFTTRLRPLMNRSKAGSVSLHHLRKAGAADRESNDIDDRVRGAGDLTAQLDELWGLESDRDSDVLVLRQGKCRWGAHAQPLRVDIDDVDDGQGVRVWSSGRADNSVGAIEDLLALREATGALRQELIDAVREEGCADAARAASRALKTLRQDGRVAQRKEGRQMRYWLRWLAPHDVEVPEC